MHFTDEAHINPSEIFQEHVLREQGTREEPENTQEMPPKTGTKIHIALWVNWERKAEHLEFYNDEYDAETEIIRPRRPGKPRRRKNESDSALQDRVREWEANLPSELEITPKGNHMTQAYYRERLLPIYIQAVKDSQRLYGRGILQEDGDPSHGAKSDKNVCADFKRECRVETLIHPAQSPDLNPTEAIWNIVKQRVRRRRWEVLEQLKEVLEEEYQAIEQSEIRKRIAEMPKRCRLLARAPKRPIIRSKLW